jgi:esterase
VRERKALDGTPRRQLLSADEFIALLREIEAHRGSSTQRIDRAGCPITMIMSEYMAGRSGDRAAELNATWREAVDVLAADRPSITVHRLPAGHDLVITHAEQVAALVRVSVG